MAEGVYFEDTPRKVAEKRTNSDGLSSNGYSGIEIHVTGNELSVYSAMEMPTSAGHRTATNRLRSRSRRREAELDLVVAELTSAIEEEIVAGVRV